MSQSQLGRYDCIRVSFSLCLSFTRSVFFFHFILPPFLSPFFLLSALAKGFNNRRYGNSIFFFLINTVEFLFVHHLLIIYVHRSDYFLINLNAWKRSSPSLCVSLICAVQFNDQLLILFLRQETNSVSSRGCCHLA